MATTTTNFGLTKPGVNDPVDANQWGYQTNTNWDTVDTLHNRWLTTDIGSARPVDAKAGTLWIDNSVSPWILYVYDGTNDIPIGTIDTTTNQFNASNNTAPVLLPTTTTYTCTINAGAVDITELNFTIRAGTKYRVTCGGLFSRAPSTSATLSMITNSLNLNGFGITLGGTGVSTSFFGTSSAFNRFGGYSNISSSGQQTLISMLSDGTASNVVHGFYTDFIMLGGATDQTFAPSITLTGGTGGVYSITLSNAYLVYQELT